MKTLISTFSLAVYCTFSLAQTLKVQTGHSSFISGANFTADGRHIITAAIDGQIKTWETSSGREIRSISTGTPMYACAYSESENVTVIADYFSNITVWDMASGQKMSMPDIKYVAAAMPQMGIAAGIPGMNTQVYRPIALHNDLLAVCNEGDAIANILKLDKLIGVISIFDVKTGKKRISFKQNKSAVSAIAFASSEHLISADIANDIKIWDVNKGKELKSISSGQSKLLTISANDQFIATGGAGGSVKVWDINSGKQVHDLKGHRSDITNISISSDGKYLASTDKYSTKLWDLSNGDQIADNGVENVSGGFANIMNVVNISPGNDLMISSYFGTVNLYDAKSGRFLRRFEGNDTGLIGNLFFPGTNNPGMLYMGADKVVAKGWDFPNSISKSVKLNVAGKMVQVHPNLESVIAWSPGTDMSINVYDFNTGKVLCQLNGHTAGIHRAIYNSTGEWIITGSQDNSIRIWNSKTGEEIKKLSRRGFAATGFNAELFISKDNKKILSRGIINTPTQVWTIENGRSINLANVTFANIPAMSPDGTMIAGTGSTLSKKGASLPQLFVFDAATGQRLGEFKDNPGSMYLSFSADSKSLALTMDDGVHVIDIASEQLKYKLPHKAVNHFAFSDDNSLIMTYGIDGVSRLWDYQTGKEIAGLVSFRDNENTIVLPNRYYYSTKGAVNGLHYVMGDKAVPFDQFDLKYNRPDLVFKVLGVKDQRLIQAYEKAYKKRLSKNGVDETELTEEFHLPVVDLQTDEFELTTENKTAKISFNASDSKYKITRIIVSVNNVPLHGKNGLIIENPSSNISKELDIELSSGRNKIGVIAMNEKGAKSIEQTYEIQYTGPASKPNLYIVSIGVSEYANPEMNLTYAAKDANDLINAYQSNSGRYGEIKVLKYLNQEATSQNILKAREALMASEVDDEVVLFVASHGLLDQNFDYYLATHDVDFNNPSENGLKYEDLESMIDGIPARKKLMLLDACHSGEVDKEEVGKSSSSPVATTSSGSIKFRSFASSTSKSVGLQNSFKLMQKLFSDLRRGTGSVVISSAGGAEYAFESPEWNNGVFTYSLLEGLKTRNCDTNQDKEIVVSELRDYVMNRVVELTNGNQNPTTRSENLEFDFQVW